MAETQQIWQRNLLNEIKNSTLDSYKKVFAMPRGSGVTTFLPKLISELEIFADGKERILVIVPNRYVKHELEYTLNSAGGGNMMVLLGGGPSKQSENLKIIVSGDETPFTSYVDWVITDNVEFKDDNLIENNSIRFWNV